MKLEILGVDKTSLLQGGTLSITRISKERRTCSASLFSAASSYLPGTGQDLKVYDDSDNLIFGGCIRTCRTDRYDSGNSDKTNVSSSLFSDGYNHIAGRRAAVTSFTTSYAGNIVESLRAVTLNSSTFNEGIGAGTIDDGAYYAVFAKETASVKDLFDELADASGFKWYIDDSKDLQFTQESSTPDAAHELMSTGTFKDFHDFMVKNKLDDYRNRQVVVGDRDADTGAVVTWTAQSTAQIAIQQAIEGGSSYSSGVYENVIRDTNIKTTLDAQTVAENALKQYGYPGEISFKSWSTDWQPSTKLKVKLPKYGIDSDIYYLIEEVTLAKINNNQLESTITAKRRDPASFGSQRTPDDIDFMKNIIKVGKGLYDLRAKLGNAAYDDLIEAARLGTTVIDGGYLLTSLLQAKSILAEKLLIGNFDNLVENYGFENGTSGWYGIGATVFGTGAVATAHSGNYSLAITSTGILARVSQTNPIEVVPGEKYYISEWYRSTGAKGQATGPVVHYYDKDDVYVSSASGDNLDPTVTYTKVEKVVTIPASIKYMRIICQVLATSTAGGWYFDDIHVRKAVSGSLTVDGKIESVDGKTYFDLDKSEIVQTSAASTHVIQVTMNTSQGLAIYRDAAKTFGITTDGYVYSNRMYDPDDLYSYAQIGAVAGESGRSALALYQSTSTGTTPRLRARLKSYGTTVFTIECAVKTSGIDAAGTSAASMSHGDASLNLSDSSQLGSAYLNVEGTSTGHTIGVDGTGPYWTKNGSKTYFS